MISINTNAPVVCHKSIVINATTLEVWKVLTEIDKWSSWQTAIKSPRLEGSLEPGTKFTWKTGGVKITSILHTVEPYTAFGWNGKTIGIKAIHNWSIVELNHQTEVSVSESMEGFLVKLLKKTFTNSLDKGMGEWLQHLKKTCEKKHSS